jgi:signal peptidase II
VFDQWTKRLAETALPGNPISIPGTGDWLRLTYVENRGAAFGLFQNQTAFFVVVGVVVIAIIAASYKFLPRTGFLTHLALGLQLGGAVGNMIDRIRQGYVVDFVDFGYQSNWWPVWNVADAAIVVGVGLLALSYLRQEQEASKQQLVESAS